jgi:hypothetical protein
MSPLRHPAIGGGWYGAAMLLALGSHFFVRFKHVIPIGARHAGLRWTERALAMLLLPAIVLACFFFFGSHFRTIEKMGVKDFLMGAFAWSLVTYSWLASLVAFIIVDYLVERAKIRKI